MEITRIKLMDMKKPEKNIRIHTKQQMHEFRRSVEMFGQIRPIVIDENNVILAGNGLYDTLVDMGKETADVYQYHNLTENQKKKLMIADNKIFSLGVENLDTLNCFLEDLQGDLDIPGFDEDILRQMAAEAEEITDRLSEYGTLDKEEVYSIQENAGKKGQQIQISVPGQRQVLQLESSDMESPEEDGREIPVTGNFVTCPSCGEKIWL